MDNQKQTISLTIIILLLSLQPITAQTTPDKQHKFRVGIGILFERGIDRCGPLLMADYNWQLNPVIGISPGVWLAYRHSAWKNDTEYWRSTFDSKDLRVVPRVNLVITPLPGKFSRLHFQSGILTEVLFSRFHSTNENDLMERTSDYLEESTKLRPGFSGGFHLDVVQFDQHWLGIDGEIIYEYSGYNPRIDAVNLAIYYTF
ncbi:hypothetical protein [Prolixibacter sp. SD074]|uniref:hypothetical protein n=1 Tax=Prolixibacter sp. SD074 TaxID=2652391 RepID=UPI001278C143|nr:hypothetical protein [Prolixibacter sp. SD074]GET28484.1 hypothetical protein SD074_06860 [Prolixibacter sp. SD074]